MNKTWLSSDYHFNHDREFIWKARGFNSVQEMNEEIIRRHNEVVDKDDLIYILGDLMLGEDLDSGMELLSRMNGKKIIMRGNHDSDRRVNAYFDAGHIVWDAAKIKYNGYNFYLSHYPTITSNIEKEALKQCTIALFGHSHQKDNFYYDVPWLYHVGVDSHNCYPVSLDEIIVEIKRKVKECKDFL